MIVTSLKNCLRADSLDFSTNYLNIIYSIYFSYPVVLFIQGRRELSAVVHCYGGGSCKITINSATTAGEVCYLQKEWSGISINTGSISPWMDQCTVLRVENLRLRLLRKFFNLRSIQNENICAPGCSYSSLYWRIGTVV